MERASHLLYVSQVHIPQADPPNENFKKKDNNNQTKNAKLIKLSPWQSVWKVVFLVFFWPAVTMWLNAGQWGESNYTGNTQAIIRKQHGPSHSISFLTSAHWNAGITAE